MLPLFAEVPDWAPWATMTVGGAVAWIATWLATRQEKRRTEKKEDEKGIVEHQGETIKRLSRELDALSIKSEKQGTLIGRLLGHVGRLEGIMIAKGMEFEQFDLDGTAEHKPIASGGK